MTTRPKCYLRGKGGVEAHKINTNAPKVYIDSKKGFSFKKFVCGAKNCIRKGMFISDQVCTEN